MQAFIPFHDTNFHGFQVSTPHAKYIPEVWHAKSTLAMIHFELIVDIAFLFKADAVVDDGSFKKYSV